MVYSLIHIFTNQLVDSTNKLVESNNLLIEVNDLLVDQMIYI